MKIEDACALAFVLSYCVKETVQKPMFDWLYFDGLIHPFLQDRSVKGVFSTQYLD